MNKKQNNSVDIIKEDVIAGTEESIQSNLEITELTPYFNDFMFGACVISTSTILGEEDFFFPKELSQSDLSIDMETSKRYTITFEQARDRALKAIKRAREQKSSLLDEED